MSSIKDTKKSKAKRLSVIPGCVGIKCDVDARFTCTNPKSRNADHYCVVVTSTGGSSKKSKKSSSSRHRAKNASAMREPSSSSSGATTKQQTTLYQGLPQPQQQLTGLPQQQQPLLGRGGPLGPLAGGLTSNPSQLSLQQLQDMAMRQQHQIESQQQMLVAKEQRLKYLRQQDLRQNQMAAEYERLRRLREKVEAQEMKLRKLRALRGQSSSDQARNLAPATSVGADLEAIRALFNEKEKELTLAVRKVDDLTHQLDDLRTGRVSNHYPPQMVELERLRRELAYRKQLNEQQNNMIAQQRDQLSRGHEEIAKMDNRILELQDRLSRKRMMNQQLANQISAATTAKQAQLRAIQQGMLRNINKPVSTVEPFQRQAAVAAAAAHAAAAVAAAAENQMLKYEENKNNDPKYQTLPFNIKFPVPPSGGGQGGQQQQQNAIMKKIEALKQEKENNNIDDLPSPPPQIPMQRPPRFDQNYNPGNGVDNRNAKPINSVAPVNNEALSSPANKNGSIDMPTNTSTPILAGSNKSSPSPPPYVPAPPPTSSSSATAVNDSTITVVKGSNYSPSSNNLSVSAHPAEEGTSVDDDMPSASENESEDSSRGVMVRPNHNVHVSISRRIEMPPAFHFPEDQTPPSDLLGTGQSDMTDNSASNMYQGLYQDFENLTTEEKYQLFGGGAVPPQETDDDIDETLNVVPDVIESDIRDPMPPSIIKKPSSSSGSSGDEKESRSRRISFDPLALLLDASLEGELELVKKTAREVPNPSAANDEGITALHNAICAGHYDIVKFLVEFGCDVNAQDADGWTPLHCAASCNNLEMVKFLVEHGACIFATTLSDRETAAEKCEEEEEGYRGCFEFLCNIQEKLGVMNNGEVFAVYDYKAHRSDELDFSVGARLVVSRRGDDFEKEWWWCKMMNQESDEGYVPRNLLGLYPRVTPMFSLGQPTPSQEGGQQPVEHEEEEEDVVMSS